MKHESNYFLGHFRIALFGETLLRNAYTTVHSSNKPLIIVYKTLEKTIA